MTITPEKDFLSTCKLSELLQSSPGAIERAATKAGISPALRLNGTPYFSDDQVDQLRRVLSPKRKTT